MSEAMLIFSDTHGFIDAMRQVILSAHGVDRLIHLGDYAQDAAELEKQVGRRILSVRGNNDFGSDVPRERIFTWEGYQFLMVHGHYHGVDFGPRRLAAYAREHGADVALFGHTHRYFAEKVDHVYCINPGSPSFPRGDRKPSYAILTVEEGTIRVKRVFL